MDTVLSVEQLLKASPLFWWDKAARQFRRANGRFVSVEQMNELRSDYIQSEKASVSELASRLFDRKIDIQDFRDEFRHILTRSYYIQYSLAVGGRANMTQRDHGIIGAQLKKQYGFLENRLEAVVSGRYNTEQVGLLTSHLNQYVSSSNQAYERGRSESFGMPRLSRYPGSGSTQCLSNCTCHLEIDELNDRWNVRWVLGATERHCSDCPSLAAAWSPLVIKKE